MRLVKEKAVFALDFGKSERIEQSDFASCKRDCKATVRFVKVETNVYYIWLFKI